MFWIALLLVLAGTVGGYLGGWSRGVRGLPRWPLRVGKDGIHRQLVIILALMLAGALVACTNKYAPAAPGLDTTAVADSDRHDGDHDRDHENGKHHNHDREKNP